MTSQLARVLERPERALWLLLAAQVLFWTLAPLFSHSAPPLDVVEMQAHGREHVVATFKHPNLPGLTLELARLITGGAAFWPAFIVSQLFIAATMWIVFALGRDLMDAPRALIGAALLTGVYFFSWPSPEFNHNVAQMPLWALVAWSLWRATSNGGWVWWIVLGLAGGFSLWAKYSSGILLVCAGIWMLYDKEARRKFLAPGPYLTLIAFALAAAPQVLWLIAHDFQPFDYAARRATSVDFTDTLGFLPIQLAHHIPLFVILWASGLLGKPADAPPPAPDKRALHYLLLIGLGPAILLTLGGLISGSGLRSAWGAPMFNLSGLVAVALLTTRIDARRIKAAFTGALVAIVVISALYFAHMKFGYQFTGKPLRGNWPQAEISETLETEWARQTSNAPLRIVAGDIWTAGLIAMSDTPPPSVLINGDYSISPWLTPEDVARDGALVVWSGGVPAGLREFVGAHEVRERSFHAPGAAGQRARPMVVSYAIIPPRADAP